MVTIPAHVPTVYMYKVTGYEASVATPGEEGTGEDNSVCSRQFAVSSFME